MQRTANPTDVEVGARVRAHRRLRGMTQSDLGAALGVSFQQVQKYEKGTNRIGASRLQDIANVLGVPVSAFFEDRTPVESRNAHVPEQSKLPCTEPLDLIWSSEGLALARSFVRISDAKVRRRVVRLVEQLSKSIAFDDGAAIHAGRSDSGRA
jgi:transcriptional regulator with XRE-family HTH domain